MNKVHLFILAVMLSLALFSGDAHAQSIKGKNIAGLGIGLGSFGFSGRGGLPIVVSFEHGFSDKISGGGFATFIKRKFYDDYTYTYFVIGPRASYHLSEDLKVQNEKLDVYCGASIFYRGYKSNYKDEGPGYKTRGGNIGLGIHIGSRYSFNQSLSGYAELGYGIAPLQLGVNLQF